MGAGQLELFAAQRSQERSPGDDAHTRALAERLPRGVHLGTSSWSFAGWRAIVWPDDPRWTADRCAREGLAIYAQHPLLRTVGIDRSYYGPIPAIELARYAAQLPPGFRAVSKAWEGLVSERVATKTTAVGACFLDIDTLEREVLAPYREAFLEHAGPLVFEFPAERRDVARFTPALTSFLRVAVARAAPMPLAVELRDRRLLTDDIARGIASSGVAFCFNFHPTMPSIATQLAWAEARGLLEPSGPPLVARVMLPPGTSYEVRKRDLAPFDRIADAQEEMRRDVVALCARAVRAARELFIVVNNKAEGCAPLTVRALAERIAVGA